MSIFGPILFIFRCIYRMLGKDTAEIQGIISWHVLRIICPMMIFGKHLFFEDTG